jgi:hypothetical protein
VTPETWFADENAARGFIRAMFVRKTTEVKKEWTDFFISTFHQPILRPDPVWVGRDNTTNFFQK